MLLEIISPYIGSHILKYSDICVNDISSFDNAPKQIACAY